MVIFWVTLCGHIRVLRRLLTDQCCYLGSLVLTKEELKDLSLNGTEGNRAFENRFDHAEHLFS